MSRSRALPNDLLVQTVRVDQEGLALGYALRNALGVGLVLLAGIASGEETWGLFAALGALILGFADLGLTRAERLASMSASTAAVTLSALVAALAAHSTVAAVSTMAVWAAVFGISLALGPVESMAARLAALSLILLGDTATTPGRAGEIALAVGVGGLIQVALTALVPTRPVATGNTPLAEGGRAGALARAASFDDIVGRYSVRVCLALTAGVLLYREAPLDHGLWVPLTVLFVLLPDTAQSWRRIFERIVGTLAGVALLTVVVAAAEPGDAVMAALATAFVVPTFAFFRANYALFSASIGASVVLLVSIAGLPEGDAALYRSIDTVVGGMLAAAAIVLVPMPRSGES